MHNWLQKLVSCNSNMLIGSCSFFNFYLFMFFFNVLRIDVVQFWSRAIVDLRDNIGRVSQYLDTYHEVLLHRVRVVANNLKSHLIRFVNSNRSLLTQFVREYWDAANRGSDINWRQAPDSPHMFLGLF